MTEDKDIPLEMLNEGDDEGPGGPPPQKCPVCGRLLAVCGGNHEPTDPSPEWP